MTLHAPERIPLAEVPAEPALRSVVLDDRGVAWQRRRYRSGYTLRVRGDAWFEAAIGTVRKLTWRELVVSSSLTVIWRPTAEEPTDAAR